MNSFLYTFSTLLIKAINFFLLPIYTMFLTPEDYGIKNIVSSFSEVAIYIITFSLFSAVIRFYTDFRDDKDKLKQFLGTIIIFVFFSSIIFVTLGFVFKDILMLWFFQEINFYPIVVVALATLCFVSLHSLHQSILQGMQEGKKLTIINIMVFILQVSLTLLFIIVFKLGVIGVLLSVLIINICYSVYMIYDSRKEKLISFRLNIKLLKDALKYSIPILPHNLSTHIASFVSKVLINISGNLASVGLYGIASQFSLIIDTVQSSVNKAFMPWFFEMMKKSDKQSKQEVMDFSKILLVIYSLLYMVIGLFSQEIIIVMTKESYIMAWTVIPILVLGFSIKSIYYFYINILFYYKQASRKIFIATLTGSFTDIILSLILVPLYGMYGAAIAFVMAKIVTVCIVVFIGSKYQNVGYRVIDMLKIIIPSLFFMTIGLYFSYTMFAGTFKFVNLLYKIGIFIFYLLFVYLTNRKTINEIIKSGKIQQLLSNIKGT